MLCVADCIVLLYTMIDFIYSPLHGVLLHVFLCVMYAAISHHYKGKADHLGYLILCMPGLGFLMVVISELFSRYTKTTEIIEDYDRYVHYISNLIMLKPLNFHAETNVMSTVDALYYGDRNDAKSAVVNLTSENPAVKVTILKKALMNDDHEIVHYAAATLTLMEQEYERRLDALRSKYIAGVSAHQLLELIECYNEFILTGLAEGEALRHYRQEMQSTIDFLKQSGTPHREALIISVENLISLERFADAETDVFLLRAMNEEAYESYFLSMKIKYNTGDIEAVAKIARYIREKQLILPAEKESIVAFWLGVA